MAETYKLGDETVQLHFHPNGEFYMKFKKGYNPVWQPQPHELRKLAQVIEDAQRAKEFPEDKPKFTDNNDVTGYIK